ncbi:hypothetical protein [Prescottella equi]|uniref:Uncharacterized protein n=1 Tax=Rhodococcus phage REQ3 TaxID=1109714 RepID=G9FH71_9CAUD|nr:hypothetical protein [Prescottella equi]YP_005087216.1 hypothetical protein RoPhREQ3_gp24 [Rhodococcus phage REQ3]AEV51960.1 hypothetical protein [Rhodococcus phage REQ3]ERN43265.1 hypothetical protein H849_24389 [Prescottella equi NBRC 101255 = C 7]ORL29052.1 hypothetical protein A6I89_01850 [Prescottella equi]QPQ77282.1 hypothetical protein I6H09_00110 [Prescottella equi]SUE04866.1 Uncharacterised protein [Prescottella equi]
MSAAEQIIADSLKALGAIDYASVAAHVVAALTNAGKVVVDVPSVAHKGPFDTDAAFFRQVAQNLDRDLCAGGSNVRHAVSTLLRNVADALTDDRRTTSEIRGSAARAAEGGERRG